MSTTSWSEARRIAGGTAIALPVSRVPLAAAHGMVLGESLSALVDLPPFATAAMDGWAVAGPGPWKVTGQVLAGQRSARIADGEAVEIATGARMPSGAEAVLRRERGFVDEHHRLHVSESKGESEGESRAGGSRRGSARTGRRGRRGRPGRRARRRAPWPPAPCAARSSACR